MASGTRYSQIVRNEYLGKSKVISAPSESELAMKVQSQLEVWDHQEREQRAAEEAWQAERNAIERDKAKADSQTRASQELTHIRLEELGLCGYSK